jgi:hypothetical protein
MASQRDKGERIMQEETTNPFEGLSEEDLQGITGGCGACQQDQAVLENAHSKIQAYRSGNRQVISGGQFHAVRSQGIEAYIRMSNRHGGNISETDVSKAGDLFFPHPDDPPGGWRALVVDPRASSKSNVER